MPYRSPITWLHDDELDSAPHHTASEYDRVLKASNTGVDRSTPGQAPSISWFNELNDDSTRADASKVADGSSTINWLSNDNFDSQPHVIDIDSHPDDVTRPRLPSAPVSHITVDGDHIPVFITPAVADTPAINTLPGSVAPSGTRRQLSADGATRTRSRRQKDSRLRLASWDWGLATSPSLELLYRKQTQTTSDADHDDQRSNHSSSGHSDTATSTTAGASRDMQADMPKLFRRRHAYNTENIAVAVDVMIRRKKWLKKNRKHHEIPLFVNTIFKIEGTFGSSVGSLFNFARWLFFLNVLLFVVWSLLVLIPQSIHFDYSTVTASFSVMDLVNGMGPIAQLWWFYGNMSSHVPGNIQWFMFIVAMHVTMFLSAFLIIRSISRSFQLNGGGPLSTASYPFSNLTLLAWDYSVSNSEAALAQSAGIAISFRDMKSDIDNSALMMQMRGLRKSVQYLPRLGAWTLSVLLMIGGCACIFVVGSVDVAHQLAQIGINVSPTSVIVTFAPSLVFVVTDVVVSAITYRLPNFENYIRPQVEFYITVIRLFAVKMATVVVILLSLRAKLLRRSVYGCAGTIIGAEMHRSLIVKTVTILSDPVFYLLVYAWGRYKKQEKPKKQFFMVPLVHDIIQVQALVWIGMLGYPLTPLYGMLYIAVAIYVYYWMLKRLSRPMERRWMQTNRSVFFLAILGVMLLVVVIFILGISVADDQYFYSIYSSERSAVNVTDSDHRALNVSDGSRLLYCGPLEPSQMLNPVRSLSYEYLPDWPLFAKFLTIISSNAIILSVLFILAAFLYILGVRISWEIERREIMIAEQELERIEARSRGRRRSANKSRVIPSKSSISSKSSKPLTSK